MTPSRPRHPGELVLTLLLIAGILLVGREAYRISGFSGPSSPGFGPLAMAGLAGGGLLVELARILADRRGEREPLAARLRRIGADILPPPVLVAVPLLLLYLLALEPLGFIVSSFLFLATAMGLLLRGRPVLVILAAGGTVAAIWLLFQQLFQVILP